MSGAETRSRGVPTLVFWSLVGIGLAVVAYSWVQEQAGPGRTADAKSEGQQEPQQSDSAVAPPPDGQDQEAAPDTSGEDGRPTMENFIQIIRPEKQGEQDIVVEGERATQESADRWRIFRPVINTFVKTAYSENQLDIEVREINLTAKRAILDRKAGTVRLFEEVRAEGKDFEFVADNVLYTLAKRKLSSQADVELRRYNLDSEGNKVLVMSVTGTGLEVDMTLRRVLIQHTPVTTLFNVTDDLMVASSDASAKEAARTLVITAEGPMVFEHPARTVSYRNNVVATSGERSLHCGHLVVEFGKDNATGDTQVTAMTAEDSVRFVALDQEATGQKLLWENLTRAGILSGNPARITTPQFAMAADSLTFFDLNSRFQVDGPGKLAWSQLAEGEPQDDTQPQAPRPPAPREGPAALMPLSGATRIEVEWAGSMAYDADDKRAVFKDDVKAVWPGRWLTCDVLEILFADDNRSVKSVGARGNAKMGLSGEAPDEQSELDTVDFDSATSMVKVEARPGTQAAIAVGPGTLISGSARFDPNGKTAECTGPGELMFPGEVGPDGVQTSEPINVRWQDSMVFKQEPEHFAEFHGKVVADRPGQKISGETLRVEFDEETNPVKITATTNAALEMRGEPEEEGAGPPKAPTRADEGTSGDAATSTAGAATPAAGAGSSDWILRGDKIIGEPPKNLLLVEGPGVLELIEEGAPADNIRWTGGMRADFGESVARFDGDVAAVFSGYTLQCNGLRLEFNDARELRHVTAEREVEFQTVGENAWQLKAGSGEAVFAPGSVLKQVIARENVEVSDANRTVRSQRLSLFFDQPADDTQPVLSRAHASGDVSIDYGQERKVRAWGDDLKWDAQSDLYCLTGRPARIEREGMAPIETDRLFLHRPTGKRAAPTSASPPPPPRAPGAE